MGHADLVWGTQSLEIEVSFLKLLASSVQSREHRTGGDSHVVQLAHNIPALRQRQVYRTKERLPAVLFSPLDIRLESFTS